MFFYVARCLKENWALLLSLTVLCRHRQWHQKIPEAALTIKTFFPLINSLRKFFADGDQFG